MTDDLYKKREEMAAGYLDGVMVLSYDKKPEIAKPEIAGEAP